MGVVHVEARSADDLVEACELSRESSLRAREPPREPGEDDHHATEADDRATGGVSAALAVVEVGFVAYVLSHGAAGLGHAVLFGVWLVALGAASMRLFAKRRAWIGERLRSSRELLERMLGHRTRLAQEDPAKRHDGEDGLLEAYLDASLGTDRAAVRLDSILGRGWFVAGLLLLVVTMLRGSSTPDSLAIGIGGVILGDRALRRFAAGVASIADAVLAFRVIRPLFVAAAERGRPGVPGISTAGPSERGSGIVLEARDITFRHDGRAEPVLRGCNFTVEEGARILVEGPSGGGKSTLAAILTGLRKPASGMVLLRGLDQATVGDEGFRRAVACAPQFHENHVLNGPFAFNLLLAGRWPASDRDLTEAKDVCVELGLGPLLERMPGGMNQAVGESGWQLSHGERSRVFLARALLQNAEVVILDESFAALDPESLELAVNCASRRARSLVVIAHP